MEAPPAEVGPVGQGRSVAGRAGCWLAGTGDGTDPDRHVHLVLLGLPGVGTSTVGRLLAHTLHRPYVDHDSIVALRRDRPERAVADDGDVEVRDARDEVDDADRDALRRVLGTHGSVVYGAGARVARSAHSDDLADAYVVWLDASPEVVVDRLGGRVHPLLGSEPLSALREMAASLGRKTRELCDLWVPVDDAAPAEATEQIRRAWRQHVDELVSGAQHGRGS